MGVPQHFFTLCIVDNSNSHMCLIEIYKNTTNEKIIFESFNKGWGFFSIHDGLLYPNIGEKVINVIKYTIRMKKLERIIE